MESLTIGIIPARRGSKRLPHKNVKILNGRPLIEWTIIAAKRASTIDKIIVTTDCPQVATIAENMEVDRIIKRPENLAGDTASSVEVVEHVLESIAGDWNRDLETFVLLQPTSPLRTSEDIDGALNLMREKSSDAVVSVCKCSESPLWAGQLGENLSMQGFVDPKFVNVRSQDLPPYYRLNGAIYSLLRGAFLRERRFLLSSNIHGYIMPPEKSIDIDSQLDFDLAQLQMSKLDTFK